MTGVRFGRDDAQLRARLGSLSQDEARARGLIVGTASQVRDQVGALAEAGVQRVMLQWLELDDLDGVEALARAVM